MCCRCYRIGDKQAIAEYFSPEPAEDLPDFTSSYDIAPSTTQPVIRQNRDTGARELVGMRWGLVGFGSAGTEPEAHHLQRSTPPIRSRTLPLRSTD